MCQTRKILLMASRSRRRLSTRRPSTRRLRETVQIMISSDTGILGVALRQRSFWHASTSETFGNVARENDRTMWQGMLNVLPIRHFHY
jgi:hypothetical protein